MSDLEDILSDETAAVEVTEEVTEEQEPEAEAEQAEAQPEGSEEAEAPSEPEEDPRDKELSGLKAALAEARGELRAYKQGQQRQQPQPEPKPAPDFYTDPQAAVQHQLQPVQQMVEGMKLEQSRFLAEREFGKDVVDAAFEYFDQHPEQSAQLMGHPSPFHAAVEVYNRQKVAAEIGNDPEAYKARIKAEALEEVKAELKAQEVAENVTRAPSSLASEPNLGTRAAPEWSGPSSLDDILGG